MGVLIVGMSIFLLATGFFLATEGGQAASLPQQKFAVIVDAGSSGSRVHVFSYTSPTDVAHYAAVDLPDPQLKVTPGLSSYAPDGDGAGDSLAPLIQFAQEKVPSDLHSQTPILLMATAGLRMLPANQSDLVLKDVRAALGASGFAFKPEWARILPGDLEGLYAWTAINFAAGNLQALARQDEDGDMSGESIPAATLGVFELGGASMQLTFLPQKEILPEPFAHTVDLPGIPRPLYTHSFLGYGMDVAWFKAGMEVQQQDLEKDPCLPAGFKTESGIAGSGDFKACLAIADKMLPKGVTCPHTACSIAEEYLPQLTGVYIATENFYYLSSRLGLPPASTLMQMRDAAEKFCAVPWDKLKADFVTTGEVPQEYIIKTCFGAAYILTLLQDAFHIAEDDPRITFSNSVTAADGRSLEVNWVFGALLVEVIGHEPAARPGALPTAASEPTASKSPLATSEEEEDGHYSDEKEDEGVYGVVMDGEDVDLVDEDPEQARAWYSLTNWHHHTVVTLVVLAISVMCIVAALHFDVFSVRTKLLGVGAGSPFGGSGAPASDVEMGRGGDGKSKERSPLLGGTMTLKVAR